MTEPIERWREDFESHSDEKFICKFPSGVYQWQFMEDRWNGFLMAKRSQPVVDLPGENPMIFGLSGFEKHELIEALTAAGIQCRIKGD